MPFMPLWRRARGVCARGDAGLLNETRHDSGARNRSTLRCGVLLLVLVAPAVHADDADDSRFNAELESRAQSDAQIDDEIRVEVLTPGESSRRVRRSTVDEVPTQELAASARQLADAVLEGISLHRRLPVVRCETDPRVLQFFLTHPDVAVAIWRAMGVSDMRLDLIRPGQYRTDGGDGSEGVITVLMADAQQQLIHCQGEFQSPVLTRTIQANALFWLRTAYQQDSQGRQYAECTADVFVAFPSNAVEAAARVASPVTNKIADRNFEEVAMFIRMMHLAMTRQPGWVEQTAGRLQNIQPERSQLLVDTAAAVFGEAQRRLTATGEKSLTPEGLRLPVRPQPEAITASPNGATSSPRTALSPEAPAQR